MLFASLKKLLCPFYKFRKVQMGRLILRSERLHAMLDRALGGKANKVPGPIKACECGKFLRIPKMSDRGFGEVVDQECSSARIQQVHWIQEGANERKI